MYSPSRSGTSPRLRAARALGGAYGGRLQFRCARPVPGDARAARGAVRVRYGAADETLSYASVFGAPDADGWTYVSAILREDFGWAFEPNGTMPSAAEMKAALALASAVEIRGDAYVYGAAGSGQEVVYLNDVQLYAPARRPGAYWR